MAPHFPQDFQYLKQSFPSFLDIDYNMELISNFPQQSFQNSGEFSLEKIPIIPGPEFPGNFTDTFPGIFCNENRAVIPQTEPVKDFRNANKRKSMETPESISANSSPSSSGKGKKAKKSENEEKKEEGVVHVRARRGQATDSHSLAERVRRGKIKERLKCLQSIVPGCYKTMGMAVMLDEIINYVQSLQHQVEFLSMKLTAASTFQGFSFESDQLMEAMQRANAFEAVNMQRIAKGRGEAIVTSNQDCQFDLSFGCYPSLSYNK